MALLRPAALGLLILLGAATGAGQAIVQAAAEGAAPGEAPPAVPVPGVEAEELGPAVLRTHGIAMYGEPKYGPDFEHFDYVNPEAPKGGTLRLPVAGSFDTFNAFNGKGTPAASSTMAVETLTTSSADEPFTRYGLLAESMEMPEDRSWIIFHLHPDARWHDGEPVTAEDVLFSFNLLTTEGDPLYRFYFQSVTQAVALDERTVKFVFGETENRELPLIIGELPVLPKHYWEGRDFSKATLEPPLGSGPYRTVAFEPGRFEEVERVEDYWGKDLPVRVGQYNYDRIRFEYFLDPTVVRQALLSGRADYFSEYSSKEWATGYEVPAVRRGLLIKQQFLNKSHGGMQAFAMNTRREIFKDRRVRWALAHAFDFQWTNKNIYYGQYVQPESYFAPTELASSGLPDGEELEILERYRGRIPEEVFTQEYHPPSTDGSGWPRANLTKAFELLAEAGWVVRDMKLVNEETGERFRFEFLYRDPAQERVLLPFFRNLERLGIEVEPRLVDTSQYINRLRSFDFDMTIVALGQSLSPGNEQREYWSSAAAHHPGSRNYSGIEDPVVDELIDLVISAPTRESLIERTRALDRVLLWGHYVIPQLISPYDRYAYWDKFGQPDTIPLTGPSPFYWWVDPEKARSLDERRRSLERVEADD